MFHSSLMAAQYDLTDHLLHVSESSVWLLELERECLKQYVLAREEDIDVITAGRDV